MNGKFTALLAVPLIVATLDAGAQNESIDPAGAAGGDGTQIVVRPEAEPAPPAADPPPMEGDTVRIDAAACRYVTAYAPSPDTDYVPGVDVDGKRVAPADLGAGRQIRFPTNFVIPVSFDLARRLGLPPAFEEKAYVGLISVENGRLSFNGQPIGDDSDAELAALCRERSTPGRPGKGGGAR